MANVVDSKGAGKRTDDTAAHENVDVDGFSRNDVRNEDVGRNGEVTVETSGGTTGMHHDHKGDSVQNVVSTKDGKGGSATIVDEIRHKSDHGSFDQRTGNGDAGIKRAADGSFAGSHQIEHSNDRHVDHGDGATDTVHSKMSRNADGSYRTDYQAVGEDGHFHHDAVVDKKDSTLTGSKGAKRERHDSDFKRNVEQVLYLFPANSWQCIGRRALSIFIPSALIASN